MNVLTNDVFQAEMGKVNNSILKLSRKEYDFDNNGVVDIVKAVRNGDGDLVPIGQEFTVPHNVYGNIEFVVRRHNVDKVAGDSERPTITVQSKYLLSVSAGTTASTFQYDRAEALADVAETIPAGSVVKFTAIAYSHWTAGVYHFTATDAIAAGSKIMISGNADAALDTRSVAIYDNAKATSSSATYSIVSGDEAGAVDLGTMGVELNHPQRCIYGSNNAAESCLHQFLNGIGTMSDIWVPKTKFDMMSTGYTSLNGFLGGFSETFRGYLGLGVIHNLTNDVFESVDSQYTKSSEYTYNGYFWLPSRKEIYGTQENAREASEEQFEYYKDIGTTDADKLMYAKGASSATSYWLRTPHASNAGYVRGCNASNGGALNGHSAYNSYGVAPLAILA